MSMLIKEGDVLLRIRGGFLAHLEEVHFWPISESISSKMPII